MVDHRGIVLDRVFGAVSDSTRRSFLRRLSLNDASISELAEPLTMSLEAASKHVRVLERAGLVRRRRVGRSHIVQLNARPLSEAADWIEHYRTFWTAKLDSLTAYLETTDRRASTSTKETTNGRRQRSSR